LLAYVEIERSLYFLEYPYYFDTLYPFMLVALAAAVFSLFGASGVRKPPLPAVAALGLLVGAAPLLAVYAFESGHLWGRRGSAIVVVLMVDTLVVVAALRFRRTRHLGVTLAPFAAVLVAVCVNFASAASATTHSDFETSDSSLADADDVFRVGVQLMQFMKANGLEASLPAFWFDESADRTQTGLASLYLYYFTTLSREMPDVDGGFRNLIGERRPQHLVLLCVDPTCEDAPAALARAGYRGRQVAATELTSGPRRYWVKAYEMDWSAADA
jgi:hypothetical protein